MDFGIMVYQMRANVLELTTTLYISRTLWVIAQKDMKGGDHFQKTPLLNDYISIRRMN